MTEQKAGLDRELWARIGDIADSYSKKEMAAISAAYRHAWVADRKHIDALERIREAAIRFRRAFMLGNHAPPSELTAAGIALEAALRSEEER